MNGAVAAAPRSVRLLCYHPSASLQRDVGHLRVRWVAYRGGDACPALAVRDDSRALGYAPQSELGTLAMEPIKSKRMNVDRESAIIDVRR